MISHCAWLYFRFPLGFREVGELMSERGMIVSYGTVRRWCLKVGQQYPNGLRRRQPQPGDRRWDATPDQRSRRGGKSRPLP
ncbi:Transposase-like protein OS=Streptomyces griseomycini OX=66895 GN=FHS37_007723 PE=4 SV=1 [Streptomyces griseomycini]|uniref:Transposase-like protein n=1 Tax=Streptomyces griseomycini TaxID=66895 RepID=A0A7W7PYP7_9ACTN|nr:transposase-like protein [Streptomyces griseomycini]GGR58614.1 hypothetical protein GCM10015536_73930 [Streptomyces griseomycini]